MTSPSDSPQPPQPRVAALIVAAGRGERLGGDRPKQYIAIGGKTLLARSIEALAACPAVASIQCVIAADAAALHDESASQCTPAARGRLLSPVTGGSERQASVLAGLEVLAASEPRPDVVLVHDAARPFASGALVARSIAAALAHGAAVPGVPVTDTIKRIDGDGRILETPARAGLRAVQTPQVFRFEALLEAHRRAASTGAVGLTDDASVMEWAGHPVHVFEGEEGNMKITTPADLARAAARLEADLEVRVGSGYDVHAFGDGNAVILGGIAIPHGRGLAGHSDADVVLHALTDAILGALGDGDIGSHFPPSDMRWKGASSDQFLAYAVDRVRARRGRVSHLDATIICEAPKIGPHREAMRARIAAIAGLPVGRVGVKATTSEQLGFTGRREGIAAQATATVLLPPEAGDGSEGPA